MLTLIQLSNLPAILQEGRIMNNALQAEWFVTPMIAQGTEIYTVRDEDGTSVANLGVDNRTITNIVGPGNSRVSDEVWLQIFLAAREIGIDLPASLKFGGPRMMGADRRY